MILGSSIVYLLKGDDAHIPPRGSRLAVEKKMEKSAYHLRFRVWGTKSLRSLILGKLALLHG